MRIEVLSHDEHTRLRDQEPALEQDKHKYNYARWSRVRKALLKRLSKHGTIDPTEYGDGDFFVGEDWFENGALSVALMKWKVFTPAFLRECHAILAPPHEDFLITVVKSMPALKDMFELVITSQRSYARFYRKTAMESGRIIATNECFDAIRVFLA